LQILRRFSLTAINHTFESEFNLIVFFFDKRTFGNDVTL